MPAYQAPLDAGLWFNRIELISNGTLGTIEKALRHASHLLQLTPEELRPLVGLAVDPDSFEELLELEDFDTAARHLVGRQDALSVEGDGKADLIRATIQCSVLSGSAYGVGDTAAKAVLNAWAACLLRLRARYGEDLSGLARQSCMDQRRSAAQASGPQTASHNTSAEEPRRE